MSVERARIKGERICVGLLAVVLLVLATKYSEHPGFLIAGIVAVVLGYTSERCALALLFGSWLLPYVGGLPVTFGYVLIAAMAPYCFVNIREDIWRLPRPFVFLSLAIVLVASALYPFTKALNLLYLSAAIALSWEVCILILRGRLAPADVRMALGVGLGATILIPLLTNLALPLVSPFWFPSHTGFALLGRLTVSVFDELIVAGYLVVLFAISLFASSDRIGWSDLWLLALLLGILVTGSRAALLLAVGLVILALFLPSHLRRWQGARGKATRILLAGACGVAALIAFGALHLTVFERFSEGGSLSSGRADSIRWALPTLNELPLEPVDPGEYLRGGPPLVPHMAPVAAAVFLGVPLACLVIALAVIPVLDLLQGARLTQDPTTAIAYVCLIALIFVTPHFADRGLSSLLGAWFALSRVPAVSRKGAPASV
ncbi:MAG: hypothetical protein KatS3mg015_0591 [Fimbriimonadales bacterium]|nr:MAG: hypothetical protein KatS3mg015_0591 [Fimbriimonadales bacterium]